MQKDVGKIFFENFSVTGNVQDMNYFDEHSVSFQIRQFVDELSN
jgi:hypothetical protein